MLPGFQTQAGCPHLYASSSACNRFLIFTTGVTPADLLMASMETKPFWSTYSHTSIGGARVQDPAWRCQDSRSTDWATPAEQWKIVFIAILDWAVGRSAFLFTVHVSSSHPTLRVTVVAHLNLKLITRQENNTKILLWSNNQEFEECGEFFSLLNFYLCESTRFFFLRGRGVGARWIVYFMWYFHLQTCT